MKEKENAAMCTMCTLDRSAQTFNMLLVQRLASQRGLISNQKSEGWTFHSSDEFANRLKTLVAVQLNFDTMRDPFRLGVHAITWQ